MHTLTILLRVKDVFDLEMFRNYHGIYKNKSPMLLYYFSQGIGLSCFLETFPEKRAGMVGKCDSNENLVVSF